MKSEHLANKPESGFSLVELLVTMAVISGCLLGLMVMQVRVMQTTAVAKQRQQATQLANRAMEQIRALEYEAIGRGHVATEFNTSDPNVIMQGGHPYFRPSYDATAVPEQLVINAAPSQAVSPISPHVQTEAATDDRNTPFTIRTYVTDKNPSDAYDGYWVTVVVTFTPPAEQPARNRTITVRSQVFSNA